MKYQNDIRELIEEYFQNPSRQKKYSEYKNSILFKKKVLIQSKNSNYLELNPESDDLNQQLLQFLEVKLKVKFPNYLKEAFSTIYEFDERMRKENNSGVINAYDKILNGFRIFTLGEFKKNGLDVLSNYKSLIQEEDYRHLYRLEKCFYSFLAKSNYPAKDILETCNYALTENERNESLGFAWNLASQNLLLAKEIYKLAKIDEQNLKVFTTNLLVGLYNSGSGEYFDEILDLIDTNPEEGFRAVFGINISVDNVNVIYDLVEQNDNIILYGLQTDILCKIISFNEADQKVRGKCFEKIKSYLENSEKEIQDGILHSIAYRISGHEADRYGLLNVYLSKTQNFNALKFFFNNFNEPAFLFHLITNCYQSNWPLGSINLFKDALLHFWSNSQDLTEEYILDLFDPKYKFGLLPVEIILCGYSAPFQVDLLKLKESESQIKAIQAASRIHHSFEKLLPLILELRNSKFKEVVKSLKEHLVQLVFESYHNLYSEIQKYVSTKERNFLNPIKEAFETYKQIRKEKAKYNDLSPHENERDLIDLYYSLENEGQAKIMKESHKASFLGSLGKSTDIVRGNSWKQDFDNEVRPLGRFSIEQWIDARAFKNPDLYEFNLKKFDK